MIDFRGIARLDITCPYCGKQYSIRVDVRDLLSYYDGAYIQDVFPYDDSSSREHLVSGLCLECQEKLFEEL